MVWKFMKRQFTRSEPGNGSIYPSKESSSEKKLRTRARGSEIALAETASLTDLSEPAWKARNFLVDGPPQDNDWWWDDADFGYESDLEIPRRRRPEDSLCSDIKELAFKEAERTRFRNRGLETWTQAREAWSSTSKTNSLTHRKRPKPLSKGQRRELMRRLRSERRADLPRRMGLDELVTVYTEIWEGDAESTP